MWGVGALHVGMGAGHSGQALRVLSLHRDLL